MRHTIADSARLEAGADFPLVNMIRVLIYDPEATRDSATASTKKPKQDRVTSYFPRFAPDPNYGLHVMRLLDCSCYAGSSGFLSTPSDLVRFGMAINTAISCNPPPSNCSRRHSGWPRAKRWVTDLAGSSRLPR
jgi:hypothetical protein